MTTLRNRARCLFNALAPKVGGAALLCVPLLVLAAPIVVTPGSSAGYLYIPSANQAEINVNVTGGGGGPSTGMGVGGISIYKVGATHAYNVTVNEENCDASCEFANWNTGAGFITLHSQYPVVWRHYDSKAVYPNCNGTMTCTVWVNTNTQEPVEAVTYKMTVNKHTGYSASAIGGQNCGPNQTQCIFYGAKLMIQFSTEVSPNPITWDSIGTFTPTTQVLLDTADQTRDFYHYHDGCSAENQYACNSVGQLYRDNDGSWKIYAGNGFIARKPTITPSTSCNGGVYSHMNIGAHTGSTSKEITNYLRATYPGCFTSTNTTTYACDQLEPKGSWTLPTPNEISGLLSKLANIPNYVGTIYKGPNYPYVKAFNSSRVLVDVVHNAANNILCIRSLE